MGISIGETWLFEVVYISRLHSSLMLETDTDISGRGGKETKHCPFLEVLSRRLAYFSDLKQQYQFLREQLCRHIVFLRSIFVWIILHDAPRPDACRKKRISHYRQAHSDIWGGQLGPGPGPAPITLQISKMLAY